MPNGCIPVKSVVTCRCQNKLLTCLGFSFFLLLYKKKIQTTLKYTNVNVFIMLYHNTLFNNGLLN